MKVIISVELKNGFHAIIEDGNPDKAVAAAKKLRESFVPVHKITRIRKPKAAKPDAPQTGAGTPYKVVGKE